MAEAQERQERTDPDEEHLDGPSTSAFAVELQEGPEGLLIRMAGELDVDAAPALRQQIDRWPIVAATTVDLGGLTFVDSTGIGCLMRLQRRVTDAGGVLVARGAPPAVRRTLEVTGVHRMVALVD